MDNVIGFNEFFDFNDSSQIDKAIKKMELLISTYEKLLGKTSGEKLDIDKQISAVNAEFEKQTDILKNLNLAKKEHQKTFDALKFSYIDNAKAQSSLNKESKDYENRIKALSEQIKKLKDGKSAFNETVKETKKAIEAEEGSFNALNAEYKKSKKETDSLRASKGELNKEFEESAKKTAKLKAEIDDYRRSNRLLSRSVNVAEDSLEGLRVELSKATREFDLLSGAERENASIGGVLQAKINKLSADLKEQEDLTDRNQRSVGKYSDALKGLQGVFGGFGGGAASSIFEGFTQGGAAGVAIGLLNIATESVSELIETTKEVNKQIRQSEVLLKNSFSSEEIDNTLASLRAVSKEFDTVELFTEGYGSAVQAIKKGVEDFGDTQAEVLENYILGAVQAQEKAGTFTEAFNEQGSALAKLGFSSSEAFNLLSRSAQVGITKVEDLSDTVNEFAISFQRQEFREELELAFGKTFSNKIFTEFEGNGKGALEAISKKIIETGNDSKEVGDLVSKAFKSFGEEKDFENALVLFSDLSTANKDLTASLTERQKKQFELIKSDAIVQQKIIELTKEFEGSGNMVALFTNRVKEIGLEILIELVQKAKDGFKFFKELLQPIADDLSGVSGRFKEFYDFINLANDAIGEVKLRLLSDLLASARNNFGSLILIGKEFQPVFDKISEVIGKVSEFITDILNEASTFEEFIENIAKQSGFAGDAIRFMGKGIEAAYDAFVSFFTGGFIINGIKSIIAGVSAISAGFEAFKNNIADFSEGFNKLLEFDIKGAKAYFSASFEDVAKVAVSAYENKIKDLTFIPSDVSKEDEETVKENAKELAEKFKASFTKNVTPLIEKGKFAGQDAIEIKLSKAKLPIEIEPIEDKDISPILEKTVARTEASFYKINGFLKNFGENITNTIQFSTDLLSGLSDFANAIFENQNQRTAERLESLQIEREKQISLAGNNAKAVDKINKEFDAKQQQIEKEQAKRKLKQARLDKALRIANIVGDTASAIIKTLTATPAPFGIPFAAAVGALGAIQLATTIATKIPSFEKGRGNDFGNALLPETPAIVNEGGRELSINKDGKLEYMKSNVKARNKYGKIGDLVNLKEGTRVLTAEQTKIVENGAKNHFSNTTVISSVNDSSGTKEAIKQGFSELELNNTYVTENGIIHLSKKGGNKIEWANKRNSFSRGNE